jgi:hypothetical protein
MTPFWRNRTAKQSQDDLDNLLNFSLGFAIQQLTENGGFYPFGAAIDAAGEIRPVTVYDESEDVHTLLTLLESALSNPAYRATALTTDITIEDGDDAISVATKHSDGTQITGVLPYYPQGNGVEPLVGELTAFAP